MLHQLIAGTSSDRRGDCLSHRATVHVPTSSTVHPVQRDEPTLVVADRYADASVKLTGSLDCFGDNLPRHRKCEHLRKHPCRPFWLGCDISVQPISASLNVIDAQVMKTNISAARAQNNCWLHVRSGRH